MTVHDPDMPHRTEMRRTFGAAPDTTVVRTTEVRESNLGWWLAALVAIVAILAVVFMVTRPVNTSDQVSAALEQTRAQQAIENAQATAAQAQMAANDAAQRAAAATAAAAARSQAAARDAAETASQTVERTGDAVADVVEPPPAIEPAAQ